MGPLDFGSGFCPGPLGMKEKRKECNTSVNKFSYNNNTKLSQIVHYKHIHAYKQLFSERKLGVHSTGTNTHVGAVGNELPEKDFLVRVERVDNETHELRDLCLESERLHLRLVFHRHVCLLLLLRIGHNSMGSKIE